jgi:hypothetical protein
MAKKSTSEVSRSSGTGTKKGLGARQTTSKQLTEGNVSRPLYADAIVCGDYCFIKSAIVAWHTNHSTSADGTRVFDGVDVYLAGRPSPIQLSPVVALEFMAAVKDRHATTPTTSLSTDHTISKS